MKKNWLLIAGIALLVAAAVLMVTSANKQTPSDTTQTAAITNTPILPINNQFLFIKTYSLLSVRSVHRTHIHPTRSQSEKQLPRNRIRTINRVQQRRLRVERQIAADSKRRLVRIPNIASAAERVSSDAK